MRDTLLRGIASALDGLGIAFCAFDSDDKALLWNETCLTFFPEQRATISAGEPYEQIIRRFYLSEWPWPHEVSLEQRVAKAVQLHATSQRAHEFRHHGTWFRVSSLDMGVLGKVTLWRTQARDRRPSAAEDADRAASSVDLAHPPLAASRRPQTPLEHAEARARRSEERYQLLATYSSDVLAAIEGGKFTYVSPSVTSVLGWYPEELVGRPAGFVCHPEDAGGVEEALAQLSGRPETDYRARARHKEGWYVWVEARARRFASANGEAGGVVLNVRSIDARKRIEDELRSAQARLEILAVTDSLTELANRRRFDDALERESRRSYRERTELSLLLLDVDKFKTLNDRHGHGAGDQALQHVGRLMAEAAQRAGDVAARIGGDEFALVLPGTGPDHALALAERLRHAVEDLDPAAFGGDRLTVSVGVACTQEGDSSTADLLKLADQALYSAKRGGRNAVSIILRTAGTA